MFLDMAVPSHTPHLILAKRRRSGHTPISSLSPPPQTVLEISTGLSIHNNGLIGRRNGTLCVLPAFAVHLHGTSGAMLARGPVAQRQRRICPCRPEGGFCLLSSIRCRWGAYDPTLTCSANNMTDRPSVCILSLALKNPQYRRFWGVGVVLSFLAALGV